MKGKTINDEQHAQLKDARDRHAETVTWQTKGEMDEDVMVNLRLCKLTGLVCEVPYDRTENCYRPTMADDCRHCMVPIHKAIQQNANAINGE